MRIKILKFEGEQLNGYNGQSIASWIDAGWKPNYPIQATNDRGRIEYHLTLTKED